MSLTQMFRSWRQERSNNQEKSRENDIRKNAETEICVADSEGGKPYVYVCGVRLFQVTDKSDIKANTISLQDVPGFLTKARNEYVAAHMKSNELTGR